MKIAIVSRKFDKVVGGVEKMVLTLAHQMILRGHEVCVISLDHPTATSFYNWPEEVQWIKLGIGDPDTKATFFIRFMRVIRMREVLKKNKIDSAVGFQIGSFALLRLSSLGLNLCCVAAERNAPSLFNYIRHGRVKRFLSNLILATSDVVSVQLESNKYFYPRFIQNKIVITPNPISTSMIYKTDSRIAESHPVILYVGRVTYQKNLEVLVSAMALLPRKAVLRIVGEGDSLPEVLNLAKLLNVSINHFPFSYHLDDYYVSSDLFCLPSRWEGFPNVVGESLAHGLPVVAFEQCAGISSLIYDGINGIRAKGIDDPVELASAIKTALSASWDSSVIRRSIENFDLEFFSNCWESALTRLPRKNVNG